MFPRVGPGEYDLAPDEVVSVVAAADTAGFDACSVTDHPLSSDVQQTTLDPFTTLGFIAAATCTLRLPRIWSCCRTGIRVGGVWVQLGRRSPKWILNASSAVVQFRVLVQAGKALRIAR